MASPSKGLGQKHARRDDVSFLEGRVFRATGPSQGHWDRKQTRLAGSRSEAQPPGAKMAVREKSVSRVWGSVKHYSTGCGLFFCTTISAGSYSFQAPCHNSEPAVIHHPVIVAEELRPQL